MNTPKDIYKQRFGRLEVISELPDRTIPKHPRWFCRCDCGVEKWVESAYLLNGHTKSCGCLGIETRKKADGISGLNAVIRGYKKNAEKRNLAWCLSDEDVKEITQGKCFYCESLPSNEIKSHVSRHGKYVYNGIDRLDNSKGYEKGNVVTCCYKCNVLKKDFSVASMIKVLTKLGYEIGVGI